MILDETLKSVKEREESLFIGLKTKQILDKEDTTDKAKFLEECKNFFQTAHGYLQKWSESLQHLATFEWTTLNTVPDWEHIEHTLAYFTSKNISFPESEVFDQFSCLKNNITLLIDKQDKEESKWNDLSSSEKWVKYFKAMDKSQYSHFLKICEYVFSIPAHNANVERVFSLMSTQWTDERNRLSVETVQNILICQYNFEKTCIEFHNYVQGQPDLLKAARSSEKYEWYK